MNGDTDKVNSQAVVVLFLLVNVFLGLIGTFWFRTRRRRSEIALRMTMGSTRGGVFRLLIGSGICHKRIVRVQFRRYFAQKLLPKSGPSAAGFTRKTICDQLSANSALIIFSPK